MYTDPRNNGIRAYREARAMAKQKATLANEIRANNPALTDKQVQAIVEGSLRSREARRIAAQAKTHTQRRLSKKRKVKQTRPFNSELAEQIKALQID